MFYKLLGKITNSNNPEYIGCFLEVSEINYNIIKEAMNKVLKDNDFEKHLNDFTYHLIEEVIEPDVLTIKDGQEHIINSNFITHKTFTVYVFYTIDTKFKFQLFYDSKYPTQLPVNIYIKEIFIFKHDL
jgi:calcineurin-like phosphoesterase family protein